MIYKLRQWLRELFFNFSKYMKDEENKSSSIPVSVIEEEPTTIYADDTVPDFLLEREENRHDEILDKPWLQNSKEICANDIKKDSYIDDKECIADNIVKNEAEPLKEDKDTSPVYSLNGCDEKEISLLDNKPFVKLFKECTNALKELDRLSSGFKSEDSKILLELINENIRTALFLAGGTPIDNDSVFDSIKHVCPENMQAKDGTPILEIIQPGVSIGERVFIRAKVKLINEIDF